MSASGINKLKSVVVSHKVFCQLFGMVQERPSLRISSPRFEPGETPDLIGVEVDGVFAFKARRGEKVATCGGLEVWMFGEFKWTIAFDPDIINFEPEQPK